MALILQIVNNNEWSKTDGSYHPESLASDGFIHCSTKEQVIEVANFLYKGQNDLVLLCIDSNRVTSPIKYEDLYEAGEDYPHIYGPSYFQRPFITITKDKNNQEYAVVFQASDVYDQVELPVSYEKIVSIIKEKGYKIQDERNVHLLKINNKLLGL